MTLRNSKWHESKCYHWKCKKSRCIIHQTWRRNSTISPRNLTQTLSSLNYSSSSVARCDWVQSSHRILSRNKNSFQCCQILFCDALLLFKKKVKCRNGVNWKCNLRSGAPIQGYFNQKKSDRETFRNCFMEAPFDIRLVGLTSVRKVFFIHELIVVKDQGLIERKNDA